ncbi:hypothetical protein F3Y22_tig00110528pilonHSYRG00166 [Hibiscus syriacus]|uniref:cellulase n=1 Tax=Hibiscus syriacus TaxID=106335 RepID=A0A6A3AB16_HIBSY|nr:hypothetical protein F3Y22_tig00110528pilonHSYRG00166 [Hibiscus syriacus]
MASSSTSVAYAEKDSETGRFLPSASKWNSSQSDMDVSLPSPYFKSYDFELHSLMSVGTFFTFASIAGSYPSNSPINFRASSGLQDGNSRNILADLVGGFYDSGNNIKFTFPTAYTITVLSWSVIEYHQKYADIDKLEHIKDVIKWGNDYLLKVFVPPSAKSNSTVLYSQASICINYLPENTISDNINV